MSKHKKFICQRIGCPREFKTGRGLSIHLTRSGHWRPEVPIPPQPVLEHVSYYDLVDGSLRGWGRKMTAQEKKSPQKDELNLGALLYIANELSELNKTLKKVFNVQ